jgi:hypothetical protein
MLLKGFDKMAKRATKPLIKNYSEEFCRVIIGETRNTFEQIIPEIPYIGGKRNQFTPVMIINGWIISFYKAMKGHGKAVEEVIKICCEVADDYMQSLPRSLLWVTEKFAFGRLVKWRMKKQARQSQKCKYPNDFAYRYVEGDGNDFDWALEFSECAVNKFYDLQGVEELKPYCNFFDVTYSKYLNMGIDANMTIGIGCQTCKLKYKKGRETKTPELLRTLLP